MMKSSIFSISKIQNPQIKKSQQVLKNQNKGRKVNHIPADIRQPSLGDQLKIYLEFSKEGRIMKLKKKHRDGCGSCRSYLPTTEYVYFCPARRYSTTIVKTTVVRLRVVYMGTFTPRTDSMVASFQEEIWNSYTSTMYERDKASTNSHQII